MRLPRASGVLLHPTSLPGPHGSGDLGPAAYHFVDWLVSAGQRLWQVLPSGTFREMRQNIRTFSTITGRLIREAIKRLGRGKRAVFRIRIPLPGSGSDFFPLIPYLDP